MKTCINIVTAAIGLPASATAAEIFGALKTVPRGSSADYLLRALAGERVRGERIAEGEVPPFSAIADPDELEAALEEGFTAGSHLIDRTFCEALDEDSKRRALVNGDRVPASRCSIDGFGEPFDLAALMRDKPFEPPFTGEWVKELNNGWGLVPAWPKAPNQHSP
jgi:hypothetical protein